jgi:asparagine synthase (glutamine-hydrolysing)
MDVAMRVNPQDKMINKNTMEKWVVRKALRTCCQKVLLLETKEQFSDGVGYGWIDNLKEVVAVEVSDEQLANAKIYYKRQHLKRNIITVLYSRTFS